MKDGNGRPDRPARAAWRYALAGGFIALIAAVVSYNDGLFVARAAGNHDRLAYLYPLLPDGLIVVCLLALLEASRAKVARSRWATAGLVLGIALTLAMNVDAGIAHSVLDAVIDGLVPVVFFVAVEVVLWHVRRARVTVDPERPAAPSPSAVPSSVLEAAKASMAATHAAGNALSRNQLQARFGLSRAVATEVWQPYQNPPAGDAESPAAEAPAGVSLNGHHQEGR
jgi:Protein of unknown function (DUF2637)